MMSSAVDPELKLRSLWLLVGYSLLMFIVYLSIFTIPVQIDTGLDWQDKIFHALAYFTLMFWFVQIYHSNSVKLMLAVAFIILGVSMEVVQAYRPDRFFEYADMIANALGVIIGLMLSATPMRNLLYRSESLVFKSGD